MKLPSLLAITKAKVVSHISIRNYSPLTSLLSDAKEHLEAYFKILPLGKLHRCLGEAS